MRPTAMAYRNLMSMDVEESIRANPLDAVVLLGGCDKTIPALLMGAASVDLPTILLSGGPMLNGKFEGRDIGSGTDVWKFSEAVRAGTMTEQEFFETEACIARSAGHCMTMGTASTMACLAEAMGIAPSGSAAIPAVDARRMTLAQMVGRRIVTMARVGPTPSEILTRRAFENAIVVNATLAGSTNAVLHLLAIAGRLGVPLTLDDFDELGREIPVLADLRPTGRFLMEEFFEAGGVPALSRIADRLHLDAPSVEGDTIGERIADARVFDSEVIRPIDRPVVDRPAVAVLHGNLCPDGAVIKVSAASPSLMQHRGRALVFDTIEKFRARRRRRPRRGRVHRPRASKFRAKGLPGDARDWWPSLATQAPRSRSGGHAPHLRRPDEWDRIRNGRPPHRPRVGGWRAIGVRTRRRRNPPRCGGADPFTCC